jgi:hypothetical protein
MTIRGRGACSIDLGLHRVGLGDEDGGGVAEGGRR